MRTHRAYTHPMTVTRAAARQALRERLGDAGPDASNAYRDAELNRWLNEGCRDVARQAEILQTTTDVDVTAGDAQYDMPADMVRCTRVDFIADSEGRSRTLEYKAFHNANAVTWVNDSEGMPALYTVWGTPGSAKLIMYPTPAYTGTVSIHYYRLPAEPTSDTDLLDLPVGWEDTAYLYAEYLALRRDRDPRWQEALQLYKDTLGAMYDLTRQHSDQATEVTGLMDPSGLPSWLTDFD